jgi:hypothetical protein
MSRRSLLLLVPILLILAPLPAPGAVEFNGQWYLVHHTADGTIRPVIQTRSGGPSLTSRAGFSTGLLEFGASS